jgi:hypothetical protein
MVYTRPAHGDPFADGSATDATVIVDALADGLEAAESTISSHTSLIALKANIASPTLTGVPAAPTAAVGTNTTQLATTAFVNTNTVRVTHPNTNDVLVEVYDKVSARWQVTHYDSGWRDMSGFLLNGWTGSLHVRRVNQTVTWRTTYAGLNGSAASNTTFLDPSANGVGVYFARDIDGFSNEAACLFAYGITGTGLGYYYTTQWNTPSVRATAPFWSLAGGEWSYVVRVAGAATPTALPGTLVSAAPYA